MNKREALKVRLERGVETLLQLEQRRVRRNSKSLGMSIERAIIQRELDELEADLVANPPKQRIGNDTD
ncbi:MAG: hypothetical protein SFV54_08960 [Bryobacteraceae bacterium]|nr:hypothetical protein [Bryobacteraceae bacterium]